MNPQLHPGTLAPFGRTTPTLDAIRSHGLDATPRQQVTTRRNATRENFAPSAGMLVAELRSLTTAMEPKAQPSDG